MYISTTLDAYVNYKLAYNKYLEGKMKITLLRHATCILEIEGKKLLLDPIFYSKGTLAPANGGKNINNPTTDLKTQCISAKTGIDAILLTHPHRDHIDTFVLEILGANIPIICPEYYIDEVKKLGFTNIIPVTDTIQFENISIKLTIGHHGIGEIEKLMGNSYGYLIESVSKEKMYITGDTVWCDEIKNVLINENPNFILAFAGNAILNGHQITLSKDDICKILSYMNESAKLLPIHLEAWNHCLLERNELKGLDKRLYVLDDNESLIL